MVKLEILYNSGAIEIRLFKTKEQAQWYVHNEGDHVWDYNIEEVSDEKVRPVR